MAALYQLSANAGEVIRTSDGAVIPLAPGNMDYRAYQAWLAAGNTPDPAPAAGPPTTVSFNQFVNRLTPQEQGALAITAQTNPQVLLWLALGAAANTVDLTSAQTSAGLQVLVTANVISSARMTQILTP